MCRFHCHLFVQYKYFTLSLSFPYVQSNDDLFFTKIKQSTILIHNANRQVRNTQYDRKINNLCWFDVSDILYSDGMRKLMYRVHAFLVVIRTRDHVAFNVNDVYVIFIGTFDSCYCCGFSIRLNENPNTDLILLGLVKLMQ